MITRSNILDLGSPQYLQLVLGVARTLHLELLYFISLKLKKKKSQDLHLQNYKSSSYPWVCRLCTKPGELENNQSDIRKDEICRKWSKILWNAFFFFLQQKSKSVWYWPEFKAVQGKLVAYFNIQQPNWAKSEAAIDKIVARCLYFISWGFLKASRVASVLASCRRTNADQLFAN